MALIERNTKSTLYKGLSSFWLKYFKDSDQLNAIYAGAETLLGQTYLDLMEIILSKSLTNIPVFKKEEWKLLVLRENEQTFDDAVSASHVFSLGPVTFSAIADKLDPTLNGVNISFVDVANVRSTDEDFFPTSGFFNHELSGKSLNDKSWTVVVPSNTTIKNAINIAKTRVISNKVITTLNVGFDATFKISFDEGDTEIDVVLTAAEQAAFVTPDDLATLLETKINKAEILVTIEAGYLIIETTNGKPIRILENNQECEDLLLFKAFNFVVDVLVPLDLEGSLLWEYTYYVQLITAGFEQAGIEYKFPIGTGAKDDQIRQVRYIMNTIYDPSLVLEETLDYRVENGFVYFKDNPFDLTNVAFRVLDGNKELAFWMSDVLFDNTLLYDRYGYRFTEPRPASEDYKLFLRGIIFYYTNGPDIDSITSALNLVAGIPVVLNNGEIVTDIQPSLIITDQNEYEIPPEANAIVSIGDTVNAFQYLTDAFLVEDYIENPSWFNNLSVPNSLMPGATLEQRQLRESVFVPVVGDGGYIIGNVDPSALVLTTDSIIPYGPGLIDYELNENASFKIEIPSVGIDIPVFVPKEYTVAASTLQALAEIITKATSQVSGVVINGLALDEDATFKFNNILITVPEATYANLSTVVGIIDAQLPGVFEARVNLSGDKILFLSPDGGFISITECSPTAQINLGIIGVRSFQGIVATADEDHLVFTNVSSASEALFRIVDISAYTMTSWAMKPFRSGSGEIVGEDGQPNLTYQIFDNILKYNTFKVTFNLANIAAETNLDDLINIVLVGKPKYVTPIVSPSFEFDDTLEHNVIIVDPDDFDTFVPADPTIAEVYDSTTTQALDFIFNTLDQVTVCYDENFENPAFYSLDPPGLDFYFNGNESNFRLDSKDEIQVHRSFHKITIGVQNNLLPEDEALFAFPGVYNYGVQTQGQPYPLTTVERVNLGAQNVGVYVAEPTWVQGPELSELDPRVTHMFLLCPSRPDSIQDLGFGVGDFMELKFWPNAGNNGKFTILNVTYNVETPYGIADIIWYRNPNAVADNIPGGKDELDGSSYSFSYKSGNVGKRWFITFPENENISEIINQLVNAVGDDKSVFPFNISAVGADAIWGTVSYTTDFTGRNAKEKRAYWGERHQLSAEWYRCFFIGGTYVDPFLGITPELINPLDNLICDSTSIKYPDGMMIGFDDRIIGNTITIGSPLLYNGGEFSTDEDVQVSTGAFVTSPIPGYVEYLP